MGWVASQAPCRSVQCSGQEGITLDIVVLLNSQSGTAPEVADVKAAFQRLEASCEIVSLVGAEDDGKRAADAAARTDILVAAGGDGTINAAATAILASGSGAVLGVLPVGTANDLSRSLELPEDLQDAAGIIVNGRSVPIDLIEMEDGRILINQANGGFSGVAAREADDGLKDRWGPFGYWRASVEAYQETPDYEVSIVADGERLEVSAVDLTVANARFSGGGVPVAPEADYSDGKMDVVVVEARPRVAMLALIPRVLRGAHLDAEGIIYRRVSSLELHCRPDMPFSIDGEICEEHPHRFDIRPGCLRVRVKA